MASSRRNSNGRSPLVNQQRQITSFFSKSPSPSLSKTNPKLNPNPIPDSNPTSPSPSPTTPSPSIPKPHKPLLLIGASPSPSPSPSLFRQDVVGKRIKVYWPLDDAWYEGVVKSYDSLTFKHLVRYDDGEEESVDLSKEKIEWPHLEDSSSKKLKRLRRGGFLEVRKMVIEDDEVEESLKEEEGNSDGDGDDDSGDEDWGKNAVLEDGADGEEEEEEDMELEDEVKDNVAERAKGKPSGKAESRKRKLSAAEKVEPAKKSKSGAQVSKGAFKLSVLEPTNNSDSK